MDWREILGKDDEKERPDSDYLMLALVGAIWLALSLYHIAWLHRKECESCKEGRADAMVLRRS